eukprot:Rhum_TRINITY_DN23691_c0_g1::Rhum_TRINITY_DN23691_c0_g1_i1::g.178554::m.178554
MPVALRGSPSGSCRDAACAEERRALHASPGDVACFLKRAAAEAERCAVAGVLQARFGADFPLALRAATRPPASAFSASAAEAAAAHGPFEYVWVETTVVDATLRSQLVPVHRSLAAPLDPRCYTLCADAVFVAAPPPLGVVGAVHTSHLVPGGCVGAAAARGRCVRVESAGFRDAEVAQALAAEVKRLEDGACAAESGGTAGDQTCGAACCVLDGVWLNVVSRRLAAHGGSGGGGEERGAAPAEVGAGLRPPEHVVAAASLLGALPCA